MPTVTVRPFNVYGPGQVGDSAMKTFIQRALLNEPLEIHGDGNQVPAWCCIDDFLDGPLLAMVHPNAIGRSFNIGNARSVITISGLAQTVVPALGSSSPIRFHDKSYADVEFRIPNTKKATEKLGFVAQVDLEEGITRTAAFFG